MSLPDRPVRRVPGKTEMQLRMLGLIPINLALWGAVVLIVRACT